jgi:hypothetical protein
MTRDDGTLAGNKDGVCIAVENVWLGAKSGFVNMSGL